MMYWRSYRMPAQSACCPLQRAFLLALQIVVFYIYFNVTECLGLGSRRPRVRDRQRASGSRIAAGARHLCGAGAQTGGQGCEPARICC